MWRAGRGKGRGWGDDIRGQSKNVYSTLISLRVLLSSFYSDPNYRAAVKKRPLPLTLVLLGRTLGEKGARL
jgi:hypothetical protein